jgi:N-ATPase, AtpR subunit
MKDLALHWWPFAVTVGTVAGLLLGVAYFAHLRRTASLYVHGAAPMRAVAETLARVAGALLLFFLLARCSAAAAIGGLVGFSIGRQWVVAKTERG